MDIKTELLAVVSTLDSAGFQYALCGGMAVVVHGYPRATRDIDLLIREPDLAAVQKSLAAVGYTESSGIIPFNMGLPTERKIFRITKIEGGEFLSIDLILVAEFLRDVWSDREFYQVGDQRICVVSRQGLIKMKRIAGRPQDFADIEKLDMEDKP